MLSAAADKRKRQASSGKANERKTAKKEKWRACKHLFKYPIHLLPRPLPEKPFIVSKSAVSEGFTRSSCFSLSLRRWNQAIRDFTIQRRHENVAKILIFFFFCLYRDYPYPLTLSNVGQPSCSWIPSDPIPVQKEKYNFVVVCLRSS